VTANPHPSEHARHDRLLVVRFLEADDDLRPAELEQARALIAGCAACAALGTELRLIADATSQMALPRRPRDFRMSHQQAAAVRNGGFRRFVERITAGFRLDVVRPLAGAAVAIGLLLVVVGSLPRLGGTASAPAPASQRFSATAGPSVKAAPTESTTGVMTPASPGSGDVTGQSSQPGAQSSPMTPQEMLTASPEPTADLRIGAVAGNGEKASPDVARDSAENPGSVQVGQARADAAGDSFPSLLVLGAVLASVGLIVIGLSWLARRIGRTI
jgi:hypothetical protein